MNTELYLKFRESFLQMQECLANMRDICLKLRETVVEETLECSELKVYSLPTVFVNVKVAFAQPLVDKPIFNVALTPTLPNGRNGFKPTLGYDPKGGTPHVSHTFIRAVWCCYSHSMLLYVFCANLAKIHAGFIEISDVWSFWLCA